MQIALYQPEIPPNTGNIARLCAATATPLHLIEPLGFSLEDKYLRRAGLDYWPHVQLTVWPGWDEFVGGLSGNLSGGISSGISDGGRLVLASARLGEPHHLFPFAPNDIIVLGPETRGLPPELFEAHPHAVRIPIWGEVRSLNLSTAAGILLYEGLRRTGGLPAE
jgi:tRNA (cytidine/uridine-2'-O-)-methyltransferase